MYICVRGIMYIYVLEVSILSLSKILHCGIFAFQFFNTDVRATCVAVLCFNTDVTTPCVAVLCFNTDVTTTCVAVLF
jgi:hypothetical protein